MSFGQRLPIHLMGLREKTVEETLEAVTRNFATGFPPGRLSRGL